MQQLQELKDSTGKVIEAEAEHVGFREIYKVNINAFFYCSTLAFMTACKEQTKQQKSQKEAYFFLFIFHLSAPPDLFQTTTLSGLEDKDQFWLRLLVCWKMQCPHSHYTKWKVSGIHCKYQCVLLPG